MYVCACMCISVCPCREVRRTTSGAGFLLHVSSRLGRRCLCPRSSFPPFMQLWKLSNLWKYMKSRTPSYLGWTEIQLKEQNSYTHKNVIRIYSYWSLCVSPFVHINISVMGLLVWLSGGVCAGYAEGPLSTGKEVLELHYIVCLFLKNHI